MVDFMGGRYIIFYHLLNSENKEEHKDMLKKGDEEDWEKFSKWAKLTIEIGEEELGETFPDDFKELFD